MTLTPARIKKIRTDLHWTLQTLGDYMEYSKQYVNNVERGIDPISEEFNKRLINALKLHVKETDKIISLLCK